MKGACNPVPIIVPMALIKRAFEQKLIYKIDYDKALAGEAIVMEGFLVVGSIPLRAMTTHEIEQSEDLLAN